MINHTAAIGASVKMDSTANSQMAFSYQIAEFPTVKSIFIEET
jgi:hypothetical protein